jgi:predicted RNA-binding Zn ribbon-like protein
MMVKKRKLKYEMAKSNLIKKDWSQFKLLGGASCLDFANTVERDESGYSQEWLTSYVDLIGWGERAQLLTEQQAENFLSEATMHLSAARNVFERAIAFREVIYRIFSAIASKRPVCEDDLASFNRTLSETLNYLQIAPTADGFTWTWVNFEDRLDLILWKIIDSAAELLTATTLNRLRECAADDCSFLFIDLSRNNRRCWCDMEDCGNRLKAKRHYERAKKKTV